MHHTVEYCQLKSSGLKVGYVSQGNGPLVIFVHGFPDTYRGFLPILNRVANAGFRAVAPALRGYVPTDIAPDGDYRVEASALDVVELADALGAERFSIVGHDWGALTGYATANLVPHRVQRLVTAAVPHTGHFLSSMGLKQMRKSFYMVAFQAPVLPEALLAKNDFARVEALIQAWSPKLNLTDEQLAPLKENFRDPARLRAALAWYRQLPRSLMSSLSRRLIFSPVSVPTRIIYGMKDGCIGPEMFDNQHRMFTNEFQLVPLREAGHFMQWEDPELFAKLVIEFLTSRESL